MRSKLPIAVLCGVLLMALAACGGGGDGARITELEADLAAAEEAREQAEEKAEEAELKRQEEETARLEAEEEARSRRPSEKPGNRPRMTPPKPSGCGWKKRKRVRPPSKRRERPKRRRRNLRRRPVKQLGKPWKGTLDACGQGSTGM